MRVLVTGSGGLIGRELTGHLAARGHGVVALQRRAGPLRRNDGRPVPSAPWAGAPPALGEVLTVTGDVRHAGFGVPAGLADGLDLVVHCAAVTGFSLDAETYEQVNVAGAANALAFAGSVPLLHVSTAYVCGLRSGLILERELDAGQAFANGYERSKAAAEGLVAVARDQGRAVAVARPSVVVGASGNGVIGVFGSIYGLIRLVAEGRIRTLPVAAGASLDLVPIDHVIGGLTDIAERMDAAVGQTFHLVSGAPVPLAFLADLALDYPGLYAPCLVAPGQFDPGALTAGEQALYGQVDALLQGYLHRNPHFDDRNLRALSGRACPPTGHGFLRGLIDHCLATGYLKERRPMAAA